MAKRTILLYGRTGAGKTAQIGQLAEHVFKTTGKRTRLATADRGGNGTIQPYINLGIIELVEQGPTDIWLWLNKVCKGFIRTPEGKWVIDSERNAQIGLFAFESMHGIAQLMKMDMERKAALGINIGGDTNTSFDVKDAGTGDSLKIGTTKGYQKYGIPQSRVYEEFLESQKLNADFILWTAGVEKGDDDVAIASKIVGPDVIGKALTGVLPKDVNLTFRIDVLPAKDGKDERHILYLGHTFDAGAGATALGNTRLPIDAGKITKTQIEPASIVEALNIIDKGGQTAEEAISKRLGIK